MEFLLLLVGVIAYGSICFVLGSMLTANAWERRYIQAMLVVNAAKRFTDITTSEHDVTRGQPPRFSVLDTERALEGLESAVSEFVNV